MDEQEKPFDMVSIVFLIMISILSDAADLATLLLFPIPIIGQAIYLANAFLLSPIVWALIQGLFIMKLGLFGKAGIFNLAGGIANLIGIPATTVTTGIAIWAANHPKLISLVTTAATTVAAGALTGGTGAVAGVARGAATAGKVAATAEKGAAGAAQAGRAAGEKALSAEKTAAGSRTAETRKSGKLLGEEPTPFEKLQKLTEEPLPQRTREEPEEGEEEEYS